MTVTTMPCPIGEVLAQPRQALLEITHARESGNGAANIRIEIGFGLAPISAKKAIGAIGGNGHGAHVDGVEAVVKPGRKQSAVGFQKMGQIVGCEPETCFRRLPGQDHAAPSRNAFHLSKAAVPVRPMMERQDRHRRIKRAVAEWKCHRRSAPYARATLGPLCDQCRRRLDGYDLPVAWLV